MEKNFYLQIIKMDEDESISLHDIVTNCISAINLFCFQSKIPITYMKEIYQDALQHYHWLDENN